MNDPQAIEVTELIGGHRKLPDLQAVFNRHIKQEGLTAKWYRVSDPFNTPKYFAEVVYPNKRGGYSYFRMDFVCLDFEEGLDGLAESIYQKFSRTLK